MQLSFVCLLMAQNFSGFNQWKQLVQLLCSCPQLMEETPDMFVEFMGKKMLIFIVQSIHPNRIFARRARVSIRRMS